MENLTSWHETHYEVVSFIQEQLNTDLFGTTVHIINERKGKGGLWELAADWTNEFEESFEDAENYFDNLETFLAAKNSNPTIVKLHIDYISCEGNQRWTEIEDYADWSEDEIRDRYLRSASYGDDMAEIINIYEVYP